VQSRVVEGNPANQILKVTEDSQANLIVMGRIGRTGLERYLLGSVAEKVVRNSRTPVMVVHG
jgi:nucleotide-binding universal stress UspA family protein